MTNYSALFERIPDDIVLSVSSRDIDLWSGLECLCGWVIREHLARAVNRDAADVDPRGITRPLAVAFGGSAEAWSDVYFGVLDRRTAQPIETAWVDRLDKAVRRSR